MSHINATNMSLHPTVILSGPTRGLGYALFDRLLSDGYPTVAIGRNLERIAAIAKGALGFVELVEFDLGVDRENLLDLVDVEQMIVSADATNPLVFISNASTINPIGRAIELTYSGLDHSMRINFIAPLMVANLLTKIAQKQGRTLLILNISSGAANRPIRGWQAYCSSKSAYKMGLDVLAAENSHVRTVHFDPGVMDTSMQELIRTQNVEDVPEMEVFRSYQEKGSLKDPADVAYELVKLLEHHMS